MENECRPKITFDFINTGLDEVLNDSFCAVHLHLNCLHAYMHMTIQKLIHDHCTYKYEGEGRERGEGDSRKRVRRRERKGGE